MTKDKTKENQVCMRLILKIIYCLGLSMDKLYSIYKYSSIFFDISTGKESRFPKNKKSEERE